MSSEFRAVKLTKPVTEDSRIDTVGEFDRVAEAKLLAERPDLAAGKEQMASIIESAMQEVFDTFDIVAHMDKAEPYTIREYAGQYYIKTVRGQTEIVPKYVSHLEKSLVKGAGQYRTATQQLREAELKITEMQNQSVFQFAKYKITNWLNKRVFNVKR